MSDLTSAELRDLMLSVGTHRANRRLSPLEVARSIDKMLRSDSDRQRCAQRLRISLTQISSFLNLLLLEVQIQHLADWRGTTNASIPFSTLSEIARLDSCDQGQVVQAVLCHDLKWKEVVQIVQVRERSGEAIEVCIERVLALRQDVETQHLLMGRITSDSHRAYLRTLSQAARDEEFRHVLRRLVGPEYRTRSRLGDETFTIVSDHDLARMLQLTADELEEIINRSLQDYGKL